MFRYEVYVQPWAVTDVHETYLYLLKRSARVAEEFKQEVHEALLGLRETAHENQVIRDSIRRCSLDKHPHGIMYEIEPSDQVIVHSVAHPKREPDFWRKRK